MCKKLYECHRRSSLSHKVERGNGINNAYEVSHDVTLDVCEWKG